MKIIKYHIVTEVNIGTEENPDIMQTFNDKKIMWSEENEEIAKREAYNSEYTIEDIPDKPQEPAQFDRVEAQATYTAMMTDTLLEG